MSEQDLAALDHLIERYGANVILFCMCRVYGWSPLPYRRR